MFKLGKNIKIFIKGILKLHSKQKQASDLNKRTPFIILSRLVHLRNTFVYKGKHT